MLTGWSNERFHAASDFSAMCYIQSENHQLQHVHYSKIESMFEEPEWQKDLLVSFLQGHKI